MMPDRPAPFPAPGAPQGFAPRSRTPAYYKHSGKAPLTGVLAGLGAGLAAGAVLAFVYAYALAYIPVIGYVTFLLSAAYGGAAGAIPAIVLRKSKVRNVGVTLAVGGLVTAVSYYVSWAAWVSAVLARANIDTSAIDLITSPAALWEVIGRINEVGAWSLRGSTPTGTILWVLWSLEAVLVLGVGLFAAAGAGGVDPFCESCSSWTRALDRLLALPPVDPTEVRGRAEARDWSWLAAQSATPRSGTNWYDVGLHVCEKCGATNTLSIEKVTQFTNAKGEVSESRSFVVDRLLIDAQEAAGLRGAASGTTVAPAFSTGTG